MHLRSVRASFCFLLVALLASACEPGMGPFQPSPWAGFPPNFSETPFSQYRTQYDADRLAFAANPATFMGGNAAGIACDIPLERQRDFARAAFMPRLNHTTPIWQEVKTTHTQVEEPPIVDQVSLRVLEGNCSAGTVDGRATIHAHFLHVVASDVGPGYYVTETELRETCDYRDLERNGECRRYQTHSARYASITSGQLVYVDHVPPEPAAIFDYGAYRDGFQSAPGLAFETAKLGDGTDTNMTLARHAASNGRLRYDQYSGGGPAHTSFFRRISDRKLHGPVVNGGMEISCYEDGARIIRAAGCGVE